MTDIGIKELHIKGGGRVEYIWQVAGIPWALSTSKRVANLVDADTTSRRAIFGTAVDGSANKLADTPARCPIFPTLQKVSGISWDLQEIKGRIGGGGWSIQVADIELGHTWENFGSTMSDETIRRGLPGVHHIAQPLADETCAWAELAADLEYDGSSLVVDQTGGGTEWEDAVELDSAADGYRLAWMGGECMVLDNSIAGGTTATILSRGAFMSRAHKHLVDYDGVSPIVYDLPPSIAGQGCMLWACHTNNAGTALLSTPIPVRPGVVSSDITTEKGITTIIINPILDNFDEDFSTSYENTASIMRYCFYRDIGKTEWDDGAGTGIVDTYQEPHLDILERDIAGDGKYYHQHVWLCGQSSAVYYETVQDVLAAMLTELAACSMAAGTNANHDQVSGNGGAAGAYVELQYKYSMVDGFLYQKRGVNSGGTEDEEVYLNELSLINGPLAWLFNLGGIYNDYDKAMNDLCYSPAPWFFYSHPCHKGTNSGLLPAYDGVVYYAPPYPTNFLGIPWMVCSGGSSVGNWDTINIIKTLGNTAAERKLWQALFYYEWKWDAATDCVDWSFTDTAGTGYYQQCQGGDTAQKENTLQVANDKLFISPTNIDNNLLAAGDSIVFGSPGDWHKQDDGTPAPHYAKATIDTYSDDPTDCYITLDPVPTKVTGYNTPFRYGSGIFVIPSAESMAKIGQPLGTMHGFSGSWLIKSDNALASDTLSDIFRAILGDPNASIEIPYQIDRSNIWGFTTIGDLWSIIDWDDLDEKAQYIKDLLNLQYYLAVDNTINIQEAFWGEMILHGLSPVLEFGYNTAGTREQWWVRFRRIGPANITYANSSGYELLESHLRKNTGVSEAHSHTWIASKMEGELNYQDGQYYAKFHVAIESSFIQGADETGTIKFRSMISHYTPTPDTEDAFKNHMRNILRFYASPNYNNTGRTQINTLYSLPLGRECLVTDRAARNPRTGAVGLTEEPAFVVKLQHDPEGKTGSITYRLAGERVYGWSPSCKIAANQSTKEADPGSNGYKIYCTPTAHEFSSTSMRADYMWFDCYTWNLSTGYEAKDCSCSDYLVVARETGTVTPTVIGGSGELKVISVSTTGPILYLEDTSAGHTHYTNWDTTKVHIIKFDEWDEIEDCQKLFVNHADDNNYLGADDDTAFRWV